MQFLRIVRLAGLFSAPELAFYPSRAQVCKVRQISGALIALLRFWPGFWRRQSVRLYKLGAQELSSDREASTRRKRSL
jgi:hypothetical protein